MGREQIELVKKIGQKNIQIIGGKIKTKIVISKIFVCYFNGENVDILVNYNFWYW